MTLQEAQTKSNRIRLPEWLPEVTVYWDKRIDAWIMLPGNRYMGKELRQQHRTDWEHYQEEVRNG